MDRLIKAEFIFNYYRIKTSKKIGIGDSIGNKRWNIFKDNIIKGGDNENLSLYGDSPQPYLCSYSFNVEISKDILELLPTPTDVVVKDRYPDYFYQFTYSLSESAYENFAIYKALVLGLTPIEFLFSVFRIYTSYVYYFKGKGLMLSRDPNFSSSQRIYLGPLLSREGDNSLILKAKKLYPLNKYYIYNFKISQSNPSSFVMFGSKERLEIVKDSNIELHKVIEAPNLDIAIEVAEDNFKKSVEEKVDPNVDTSLTVDKSYKFQDSESYYDNVNSNSFDHSPGVSELDEVVNQSLSFINKFNSSEEDIRHNVTTEKDVN